MAVAVFRRRLRHLNVSTGSATARNCCRFIESELLMRKVTTTRLLAIERGVILAKQLVVFHASSSALRQQHLC